MELSLRMTQLQLLVKKLKKPLLHHLLPESQRKAPTTSQNQNQKFLKREFK